MWLVKDRSLQRPSTLVPWLHLYEFRVFVYAQIKMCYGSIVSAFSFYSVTGFNEPNLEDCSTMIVGPQCFGFYPQITPPHLVLNTTGFIAPGTQVRFLSSPSYFFCLWSFFVVSPSKTPADAHFCLFILFFKKYFPSISMTDVDI